MKDGVMPKGTTCILIILLAGVLLKEFSSQQCNLSATVLGTKTLILLIYRRNNILSPPMKMHVERLPPPGNT